MQGRSRQRRRRGFRLGGDWQWMPVTWGLGPGPGGRPQECGRTKKILRPFIGKGRKRRGSSGRKSRTALRLVPSAEAGVWAPLLGLTCGRWDSGGVSFKADLVPRWCVGLAPDALALMSCSQQCMEGLGVGSRSAPAWQPGPAPRARAGEQDPVTRPPGAVPSASRWPTCRGPTWRAPA